MYMKSGMEISIRMCIKTLLPAGGMQGRASCLHLIIPQSYSVGLAAVGLATVAL